MLMIALKNNLDFNFTPNILIHSIISLNLVILFSAKKERHLYISNLRKQCNWAKMVISVRKIMEVNLEGGVVIDGFPSAGLVNAVASECIIRSTKTKMVGVLDSPDFPTLSIISNYLPQFPARIYANEELKIAFFVTELEIDKAMYREIAETMLKWALDHHCRLIISAAGVTIDNEKKIDSVGDETDLFAISSIKSGQATIKKYGFPLLKSGIISGIPAILLNEANLLNFEVIVLAVRVIREVPDFRAAATVSDAITKIVPGVYCDIGTLMVEAKMIEEDIKKIRENQRITLRAGIYT
jgi:uncharacterized protein